jgi:hypothetical protein
VPYSNSEVAAVINGTPSFLGVIVATTSKTNDSTASAFNNSGTCLGDKVLMLQSDVNCYIQFGSDNTVAAVATATGASVQLTAGERVVLRAHPTIGKFLACIPASGGTANLKVWELL